MHSEILVYIYASLLTRDNPTVKNASKRAMQLAATAIRVWPNKLGAYSIKELADELVTIAVLGIKDSETWVESKAKGNA